MEADNPLQERRLEVCDGFPALVIRQMARVRVDPLLQRPRVGTVAQHVLVVVGLEKQQLAALESLFEEPGDDASVSTDGGAVIAVVEDVGHVAHRVRRNEQHAAALLADACDSFEERCVRGIEPDVERIRGLEADLRRKEEEIDRIRRTHGNEAIYGGSYGWASAGRFHHAQSQAHRFLNCIGGYTSSFASYSTGCAQSIMPHVFGVDFLKLLYEHQDGWATIHDHTETLVMFGGINPRNSQVSMGS